MIPASALLDGFTSYTVLHPGIVLIYSTTLSQPPNMLRIAFETRSFSPNFFSVKRADTLFWTFPLSGPISDFLRATRLKGG